MISILLAKLVTFPGHLKRFKEVTTSGKKSLKVVAIFILFRISSFFSIRITLVSPPTLLVKKYVSQVYQKGLVPLLTSSLLKQLFFGFWFKATT